MRVFSAALRTLPVLLALLLVHLGGCSDSAGCADGTDQLCQESNHSNCVCTPTCDYDSSRFKGSSSCDQYAAVAASLSRPIGMFCDISNICVPTTWPSNDSLTIEPAPPPADGGGP